MDIEDTVTTDPAVVIDLTERRNKNKRSPNKGGASIPAKYKKLMTEAVQEVQAKQLAELTDAEKEFVELIVSGASQAEALLSTHPEVCAKRDKKTGEPVLDEKGDAIPLTREQLWERAATLLRKPGIRASLKLRCEQEMDDVKHTSLLIHNFVRERLLIEASTATTPAARIAALDRLRAYGDVAVREAEQTKKMQTKEEVLEAIHVRLKQLNA